MIYLVRHGESLGNIDFSVYSRMNNREIPLTDRGIQQAENAARLTKNHAKESRWVVFTSPYKRCVDTANIILRELELNAKPRENISLAEISVGEQEGCDSEDFTQRPIERTFHEKSALHYKPLRGESFLDLHTRCGLFVTQQNFFQRNYQSYDTNGGIIGGFSTEGNIIIVAHASLLLMMHYFLTETVPQHTLHLRASKYWPNALVRAYQNRVYPSSPCSYLGCLQEETQDCLGI